MANTKKTGTNSRKTYGRGPYHHRTPEQKELYARVDNAVVDRGKGTYPQELKLQAVALSLVYGSASKAAKELDLPADTVRKWKDSMEADPEIMKAIEERKGSLVNRMQLVMDRALEQTWSRMGDASAAQAATIFGILFDKKTIAEHGGSNVDNGVETTIIYNDLRSMDAEDKEEMLQRILNRKKRNKQQELETKPDPVEAEAEVVEDDDLPF